MLEALERGVRGGKWHSLYDKVYGLKNLKAAWRRVEANQGGGGVDRMSVADFALDAETRLKQLSEALRTGAYKPLPVKRTYIPKPGSGEKRPLGIPTIIDRIVQTALRNVIEPIFEQGFDPGSYGFRPQRGCHDALEEVERLLAAGYVHVVDVDLRKYFDTIPHEGLMNEVAGKIADGRVLDLIEAYLRQGVLDQMKLWIPERVFYGQFRDPRQSSEDKLKATIRTKTKQTNGNSLSDIIQSLNASLRGWYNYFKFCSANSWAWKGIDAWIRRRLRAILDQRRKGGRRRCRGRGHAHYRWPNAYFTEQGLFSLESAVKLVRQS
jgi:retron-type reverse transcriptase